MSASWLSTPVAIVHSPRGTFTFHPKQPAQDHSKYLPSCWGPKAVLMNPVATEYTLYACVMPSLVLIAHTCTRVCTKHALLCVHVAVCTQITVLGMVWCLCAGYRRLCVDGQPSTCRMAACPTNDGEQ